MATKERVHSGRLSVAVLVVIAAVALACWAAFYPGPLLVAGMVIAVIASSVRRDRA